MLKIIIAFIVFVTILFLYLHVQFHLKKSEDVEMYEVDWPSKEKLEKVCDLRQPLLFDFDCKNIMETTNTNAILSHHPSTTIRVRNTNKTDNNADLYMPLQLGIAAKLFKEDKSGSYFSENNSDLLEETGLVKVFKNNDGILQPYMVFNSTYDIMLGSANSYTPFRYELGYRNYLLLTQGSAQIKMAPPNNIKHLYPNNDYENMEFSSPINPWNPQEKYAADFNKIKCIDFTLLPGKTLYIPAYWWYSVKFNTDSTSICSLKYRTYMNSVTIIPQLCLHLLQIQNIKRKIAKKFVGDSLVVQATQQNDITGENNKTEETPENISSGELIIDPSNNTDNNTDNNIDNTDNDVGTACDINGEKDPEENNKPKSDI